MRWSEFMAAQPAIGELAHAKLVEPGVLLVGSVRRDGTARISAVEPLIAEGQLWLSMMRASHKARDLVRDRRVVLNSIVTDREATEVKVRGTVQPQDDPAVQRGYASAVADALGWRPVPWHFALFTVDIGDVTYIGYDPPTGSQHVARWPPGAEYLRPATTPTSLGPPQEIRRLLR